MKNRHENMVNHSIGVMRPPDLAVQNRYLVQELIRVLRVLRFPPYKSVFGLSPFVRESAVSSELISPSGQCPFLEPGSFWRRECGAVLPRES